MAKKTEEIVVEAPVVETIKPLEFADLNTIKDKINEIIAFITK